MKPKKRTCETRKHRVKQQRRRDKAKRHRGDAVASLERMEKMIGRGRLTGVLPESPARKGGEASLYGRNHTEGSIILFVC